MIRLVTASRNLGQYLQDEELMGAADGPTECKKREVDSEGKGSRQAFLKLNGVEIIYPRPFSLSA